MRSHGAFVVLALVLAAGCGRTELRPLAKGASSGARGARDAGPVGGDPDADAVEPTGGQDDAARTEPIDAQTRVPRIKKIAAGSYTACALMANGAVKCWFAWNESATTIPSAAQATDIAVISGDREPSYPYNPNQREWDSFCVAMPGMVVCNTGSGIRETMAVDTLSVSVGVNQTCAVMKDGRMRCYGYATDLDPIRETTPALVGYQSPVDVPGVTEVVQVSAGDRQVCALLKGGRTSCFGNVRDDVVTDASLPQPMSIPPALDLSAADDHYCVVTTEGEVVCRGCFYNGGGGGPDFNCSAGSDADLAALGNRRALQVRTSYTHRCVRLDDGAVRCWGNNSYGELGHTATSEALPLRDVEDLAGATDIAVGVHFSCALTSKDDVYCWGNDFQAANRGKPNLRRIKDL